MKVITSRTEKKIMCDMGKFHHVVTYKADDTLTSEVRIEELEDRVCKLIAPDVVAESLGTLKYSGGQIVAEGMPVCECFVDIVKDMKAIIASIETGQEITEKPFPATMPEEAGEEFTDMVTTEGE